MFEREKTLEKSQTASSEIVASLRNERGSSVVEVMFATVIFMIIMLGGLDFYLLPQTLRVRQRMLRVATVEVQRRMETLLALDYTAITADSNETSTPVTIGGLTGTRTTTVSDIDDAADGLAGADADNNTVDYRVVTVRVSWNDGNSQNVEFMTRVSSFGY